MWHSQKMSGLKQARAEIIFFSSILFLVKPEQRLKLLAQGDLVKNPLWSESCHEWGCIASQGALRAEKFIEALPLPTTSHSHPPQSSPKEDQSLSCDGDSLLPKVLMRGLQDNLL